MNDRQERLRAIGALIWKDPGRILEAAAQLRGSDAVIECRLRGASMGAAIPAGAALRIALGRKPPYRAGEIVAFVQGSRICVHRVAYIGRAGEHLLTQGDACYYPDAPVRLGEVLGTVREFRRDGPWQAAGAASARDRARSGLGRLLLRVVAMLMELSVPLARAAARVLRLRKEGPAKVDA